MRAKGIDVTASDVHDAWAAWALEAKPDHSAIHPFEHLDLRTQLKDEPYVAALRRVATMMSSGRACDSS